MTHVVADRVKETTTTTGTGNVTLAGAVSAFRAFSAVMANNDTCLYCIAHQAADEWEVGLGTFVSATPALARTTVLASSTGSAINFSAGTKDVFITSPAITQEWGSLSPAQITANQNDYSPTGLATTNNLRLTTDASRNITGLAGGADGRILAICNVGSNPIVLKDENASSSAANRFALAGSDIQLNADEGISLWYDGASSRWRPRLAWPSIAGLTSETVQGIFDDSLPVYDNSAAIDRRALLKDLNLPGRYSWWIYDEFFQTGDSYTGLNVNSSGTSAGANMGTSSNVIMGVVDLTTGSTATGRCALQSGTSTIAVGNGRIRMIVWGRLANLSDGTNTYTARLGFQDANTADSTDGIYFRYTHGTNSGNWQCVSRNNSTETVINTSVAGSTNWARFEFEINAAGTSIEFWIDGASQGTITTNIPGGSGRETGPMPGSIIKSVGTTARILSLDAMIVFGELATTPRA